LRNRELGYVEPGKTNARLPGLPAKCRLDQPKKIKKRTVEHQHGGDIFKQHTPQDFRCGVCGAHAMPLLEECEATEDLVTYLEEVGYRIWTDTLLIPSGNVT